MSTTNNTEKDPYELSKTERIIYKDCTTVSKITRDAWNLFLMRSTIDDNIKSLVKESYSKGFNFVLTCAHEYFKPDVFNKFAKHLMKMEAKLNHDQDE